jgi:hypothetical protein
MTEQRVVELLAAHADALVGCPQALQRANPSPQEREQVASLFGLAEELKQRLVPVRPAPAFAQSLKRELIEHHSLYATRAERTRRTVVIGAVAAGSVLSLASIVTAIVLVVSRSRSRSGARALTAL